MDLTTASGQAHLSQAVSFGQLSLGTLTVKDAEAGLMPMPFLAGVIGIPLLSQRPLLLDGVKHEARLLPLGEVETELGKLYPKGTWHKVPLYLKDSRPVVELLMGEKRLRWFADTGAGRSGISSSLALDLGLKPIRREFSGSLDASGIHMGKEQVFLFEGAKLGGWTLSIEDVLSKSPTANSEGLGGVLGYDFLGSIPCVFDWASGWLWVLDPPPGSDGMIKRAPDVPMAAQGGRK